MPAQRVSSRNRVLRRQPGRQKPPAPVAEQQEQPAGALVVRQGGRALGTVTIAPAGLAVLERMFAAGQDFRTVAKALGISGKTLQEARKRQPEVDEAWERGIAGLADELTHILLQHARKGNVVAAIFLAKARLGWREGDAPEARANIVINLPDAATPEAYMRMVGAGHALPGPSDGGPVR